MQIKEEKEGCSLNICAKHGTPECTWPNARGCFRKRSPVDSNHYTDKELQDIIDHQTPA